MTTPPVRFMYIGNLETYQGVDLMIQAFAIHHRTRADDQLIVIGGVPADVEHYKAISNASGLNSSIEFRGHQPVSRMAEFFREADVLVSPRIKGTNTPMKIYSYLDAGKPVLATDLFTHTQVLTPDVAVLVKPEPEALALGMLKLAEDALLRETLARKGRDLIAAAYSVDAFKKSIDEMYSHVEKILLKDGEPPSSR